MNDMTELLAVLRDRPQPAVDDHTVRRDVLRGRAGIRRRNLRAGVVGLGFAALATVGVAVTVAGQTPATPTVSPSRSADPAQNSIELVAYQGDQERGFVVEKVPEGFELQGTTPYSLVIARHSDHTPLDAFEDKLVVMLESSSATGQPQGDQVVVGSTEGWLRHEAGSQILTYDDGKHRVVVQAWSTLGLTDAQVIEFAEGVTVTTNAQPVAG